MFSHKLLYSVSHVYFLILLLLHFQSNFTLGFHFSFSHFFHRHTPTIKLPNDSATGRPKLPINSTFQFPSPLPNWPKGSGFATGVIDLGNGLNVTQLTTFKKIWSSYEGGPDNLGVTLFEPSEIPDGYTFLASYAQPNNKPLSGWLLVAKDYTTTSSSTNKTLSNPVDYTLLWTSQSLNIKQDGPVYIWTPIPPTGYKAVGHVITLSPDKPPLNSIKCVRADLTDQCQPNDLIWGYNGLNLYSSKPINVSFGATAVTLGGFIAQKVGDSSSPPPTTTNNINTLACLRNSNPKLTTAAMPTMQQLEAVINTYAPIIHLHPNEQYHPSTVNWYFANGASLYSRDSSSTPIQIQLNGTNLPQGGTNDGAYWIDLPAGPTTDAVKHGDINTSICYLHVKPMMGGTVTDIAVWVFYPFNGPARLKLNLVQSLSLGKVGEHVGDWEHLTLRVSNFNGELRKVYFSQHSKGEWVDVSDLEFGVNGSSRTNRVVVYASLHGHAMYPREGTVVHGGREGVGVRDDTAKGGVMLDMMRNGWEVISGMVGLVEPPWVGYMREWGPKVRYDVGAEIGKASGLLPGLVKKEVEKAVGSLPPEVLGEEGPTGPKVKGNWFGDEC